MPKTLIICESTQGGTDSKIISSLISTHSLLPQGEHHIHTTEDRNKNKNGSIEDIKEYIKNGLENDARGRYKTVLIIVDADNNPQKQFRDIKKCFNTQYFKIPSRLNSSLPATSNKINVGIYLLPNNQNAGGLETLCFQALKGDIAKVRSKVECVDAYIDCLKKKNVDQNMTVNNTDKSRFRVYHSTPNPDGYVHDLLNVVDITSASFSDLKTFISQANR